MSHKVLDLDQSRVGSLELMSRVMDLQSEIYSYESKIEKIESLLESILICLNAYVCGDSNCSIDTLVKMIVEEIYHYRLQGDESKMPFA